MPDPEPRVVQMRLVVEADDYDAAVRFYRDVLGLPEELAVAGPDGAATTDLDGGAELVAPPTETPWGSLNSRLSAPAGLQITLFQEVDTE